MLYSMLMMRLRLVYFKTFGDLASKKLQLFIIPITLQAPKKHITFIPPIALWLHNTI